MATAARQVPRSRIIIAGVAAVILVAVAVWVPLPTAVQLRDWATSVGPWSAGWSIATASPLPSPLVILTPFQTPHRPAL